MNSIFKMAAIAASMSIFILSGCGKKNDDQSKQKQKVLSISEVPIKNLINFKSNSKIECSERVSDKKEVCVVILHSKENTEILSLDLAFNNSNKGEFLISNIRFKEGALLKQAIKDSFEESSQEVKNLVNKEINEFESNIISNVIFGQNESYKTVFEFSNDDKVKSYIIRILDTIKPQFENDSDKNQVDMVINGIKKMGKINIENIKKQLDFYELLKFQKSLDKNEKMQNKIYRNKNGDFISSYYDQTKNYICTVTLSPKPSISEKVSFIINEKTSYIDSQGKPCL